MNVTAAIAFVRNFARNGQDSSVYPDSRIEYAILAAGNDFVNRVMGGRSTLSVGLTPGVSAYSISTSGFLAEYALSAFLTGMSVATYNQAELTITSFDRVNQLLQVNSSNNPPQLLGFSSPAAFSLFPTPDQAYTLNILWRMQFSTWSVPGGESTVLNIPDETMMPILRWGVVAALQENEPDNAQMAERNQQQFMEFCERCKDRAFGSLGRQVEVRTPPRRPRFMGRGLVHG